MAENTQNLDMQLVGTTPQDKAMSVVDWRTNLNGVTNSSLKKIDDAVGANPSTLSTTAKSIVPAVNELDGDKYDNVVEDINAGTLTFSANGVDKKTVQTGNPNAVTVDGQKQSNIDFIRDEVVNDGLIINKKNESTTSVYVQDSIFCGFIEIDASNATGGVNLLLFGKEDINVQGIAMDVFADGSLNIRNRKAPSTIFFSGLSKYKTHMLSYSINKYGNIILSLDGSVKSTDVMANPSDGLTYNKFSKFLMLYNRPLTPPEIQHNFQVLNNSPSVNGLTTTDSTGAKKSYEFSTNSYQTTMASGDNLEQAYSGLLSAMGREFVAVDNKIEVNNGVEKSKVLSAEIKGNTVKNEFYSNIKNINVDTNGVINLRGSDFVSLAGSFSSSTYKDSINTLKSNTKYTVIIEVHETNLTTGIFIQGSLNVTDIKATSTGLYKFVTTSVSGITDNSVLEFKMHSNDRIPDKSIKFTCAICEGDIQNHIHKQLPFGLSSTVASINANGQTYPIYEPTIQGKTENSSGLQPTDPTLPQLNDGDVLDLATRVITFANGTTRQLTEEEVKAYRNFKRVISLPFAEDKVTIDETGSATWVDASRKITQKDMTIIKSSTQPSDTNLIRFHCIPNNMITNSYVVCNLFDFSNNHLTVENKRCIQTINEILSFVVEKAVADTAETFIQYITNNNIEVIFKNKTPNTTFMEKSIVPVIPINKTNILTIDSPVLPSSFAATIPTTDNIYKQYTLTPINSWTGTTIANQLKDGNIELVFNLTVPATFNQTITTLPTELRPTSAKSLIGINGNSPVVVTVGTDGSVKCPSTITGTLELQAQYSI